MLREMTRAECEKILMVEILRTYLEYLIILVGMFSLRYQFSAGMRSGQVVATWVMIRLITSLHGTSDIRQVLPVFTPAWVDIVTENQWRGSHLHE